MIVSLLLPLLVAGAVPADSVVSEAALAGSSAAAAVFGDPPVRIDLNERVYRPGERARVRIETEEDGYLLVFQADVDGNLRVLYPLDPFDDSFVRGDRRIQLDGRGDRETFLVDGREGQGWIYAAWSRMPFQVERYALGDHWDYQRLSPNRLPQSPEPELTELVRGIARASFDYDVVPYTVAQREVATTVVHRYDPFYYDCLGCGYHRRYGSSFTIHIGAPSRYYRCWDAYWCDPYYYDPYYYRPRYVYYPHYYGPRHYRPYYYPPTYRRYAGYDRRYFGPNFGDGVPYRDRRADGRPGVRLVSDNTVYGPPPRRVTSGFAETPARRQIEESPGYDLSPAPGRRGDVSPSTPTRTPSAEPRSPEPRSRTAEPRRAEPSRSEPSRTEPSRTAPSRDEPRRTEPSRTEPRRAEPSRAEPSRTEPSRTEPSRSEPRRRDSGPREATSAEPTEIEARPARPATTERWSDRTRSSDRTRADDRAGSDDRSRTEARPSRSSAPERRAAPAPAPSTRSQPEARSGGGNRGSSSGGSARAAPSRSGGSSPSPAPSRSGGGRRPG